MIVRDITADLAMRVEVVEQELAALRERKVRLENEAARIKREIVTAELRRLDSLEAS